MSQQSDSRPDRESFRRFGPTALAVKNRISVLVLLAIVAVVGLASYTSIPKESSPEIVIPLASVSTVYPGVAPSDMETLVARVIEEELYTIPEITELSSTSVEGYAVVTAEFDTDMDMEEALQKVREKVDLARPKLPADAEEPVISEINFSEFPIMQVNISAEYDLVRLKEIAEDLQERLEQIPSILEVRLNGGLEREVRVEVDLNQLKYYGIAFADIIDAIRLENVTVPGGAIDVGNQKFLVRVEGEFPDTRMIEDIVVLTKGGRPIYVRDVATVDFGFMDRASYARLDGSAVVTLDIVKRSGENIIATADAVRAVIAEMQPRFPPTTVVKITGDESEMIHEMVSSLENNIISGLLLVVAVLLFFLGLRNAGFVGISIPLSMLLSFIVMKAVGITMNMVVLFSLILALGMLVDNAIVIVENIYRYMEQGTSRMKAAVVATGEVAQPVIASTLTTVAAFLPLAFWPGIVGEFMSFLPKTLIITLASSLFVALVIVPVLCALFMRLESEPPVGMTPAAKWTLLAAAGLFLLIVGANNPLTAVLLIVTAVLLIALNRFVLTRAARWFQNRALPRVIGGYERRLRWALDHRMWVLGGTIAAFFGTIVLFGAFSKGIEFFPEDIPPSFAYVQVDVPSGTSIEFTNSITRRLETELGGFESVRVDAKSVVTTVNGGETGSMFGSNKEGTLAITFQDYTDRQYDVFETLRRLQENVGRDVAGADVTVQKPQDGPGGGKPVNIEIVGEDIATLRALSDSLVALLESSAVYAKLEGLESDMARGRPELVIDVDREKAALYGLNTSEIGGTVRSAIQGTEAAKYRTGADEYDITVRLAEPYRNDLRALEDFTVLDEGRQIPLPSVASWRIEEGMSSVIRKDLDRVATISSNVRSGENSNAVLAEVQQTLAGFSAALPPGYDLRYTGQQEDQAEAMAFLSSAFLLALMLIALILVSQFNSAVKPMIIMTSVIMSTVGVLAGLLIFQMPFGIIMTGVGVISLAGVVVNNAIVLVDYVDILRERDGLSRREALVRAGVTRFRPVVLTAITTVLGLVPLAVGFNFDFLGLYTSLAPEIYWGGEQAAWWGPMAVAVIAGLTFATFLTLVLVPIMYSLTDDFADFFRRHYTPAARPPSGPRTGEEERLEEPPVTARPAREREREPALLRVLSRWRTRPAQG